MLFFGASGQGTLPPTMPSVQFRPSGGAFAQDEFPVQVQLLVPPGPPGLSISYTTDGSTPTSGHGTIVTNGAIVAISAGTTLKAMAFKSGWTDSGVTTATYVLRTQAAAPTFTPAAGPFPGQDYPINVVIDSASSGVRIRYTTDGTTPTSSYGHLIPRGGVVQIDASGFAVTLKAIAYGPAYDDSDVTSGTYTAAAKVQTPRFSLLGGTYGDAMFPLTVTIDCQRGATIWYTTDGTLPIVGVSLSIPAGGSVQVTAGQLLTAVGAEAGYTNSAFIASGTYNSESLTNTITFTPNGGVGCRIQVKIATPNQGCYMKYYNGTPNPPTPSCTNGITIPGNTGVVTVATRSDERIRVLVCKAGYFPTPLHLSNLYTYDPNQCS